MRIIVKTLWTLAIEVDISAAVFRRSSAVEQLTVNQLVVGSIPTVGAKIFNLFYRLYGDGNVYHSFHFVAGSIAEALRRMI